ncbi:MAG TPA: PQQ-binding-like beta-propeller repeat protein [Tepidisphaeraceae bacterium]|jgi:outer membrane protein assembly factor BamB/tetratricopeptide (TPR) repeat protein|nr:PQQ-binding-like beta-propeller repeat protein [Tepidisphaeraceae bacterium]
MLSRRLILAVAIFGALPVVPSWAQGVDVDIDIDEAGTGLEPDTGIYVRDSAIVTERIVLAERMERSKEWGKAADLLQEVIEKHGQRIVPTNTGADAGNFKQYIGATDLVQRRLAEWPADGLAAYRARFGQVAQTLLDASPFDRAVLGRVERDYFVTDAGKTASMRLVDLSLAAGEFGSAIWMTDRLLAVHPNLADDRAAVLFRAGLARHLAGDAAGATKALDELKAKHPDATATVAGGAAPLVDTLAKALAEPASAAAALASDSWPTLGGGPSRGRVPAVTGRPGARMFGIDLSSPLPSPAVRAMSRERRNDYLRRMSDAEAAGVMPVVDGPDLFFNDGQRVYAVSVDSGVALSGWATTYPGELQGRYTLPGAAPFGGARGRQLNTTVTDDAVLAIMGQGDRRAAMNMGQTLETKLVCLDRRTGAQRWVASTADLPDEAQRAMALGGSPLVIGDNVYVTGRSAKQANFEDCYVICFNLADGKAKWTSYISGASVFNSPWGGMPIASDNDAHVAFAGGRLFVSTNLGAVAALDAYSGGLLWLTTYPRGGEGAANRGPMFNPQMAMRMNGEMMGAGADTTASAPWAYNPPIVRDGHIFTLPVDARDVIVFDAGNGAISKRIARRHLGGLDTLVGVSGDSVIVAGNTTARGGAQMPANANASLLGIDWRKYDPDNFRVSTYPQPADPSVTCRSGLGGGGPLMGRPFLTETDVFIPTERRLFRFQIANSQVLTEGTYPASPAAWDRSDPDGEGPGNVLVVGDHVVLAGPRRVDVYMDRQLARQKWDAREAAAPNDPEPRIVYAEVMFAAGDVATSLQKIDAAIGLMGGADALRPGPLRERLFNDALTFANKLAEMPPTAPSVRQQASDFFDRAAIAAATPQQGVAWRLARARLYESMREYPSAVRMYQEVLSDDAMRKVPSFDERSGPTSAAAIAERRIDDVLAAAGSRQPYVAYELVAEEKFNAARKAADAAALLGIAQVYPNANVAPRALVAATQVYEQAGDHRLATHVLRQALRKSGDGLQRATITEALARNYLMLPGGVDSAIPRLQNALRNGQDPKLTQPMKLADGTELAGKSFMSVLNELRPRGSETTPAALPDLRLAGKEIEIDPATNRKRYKRAFVPADPSAAIVNVQSLVLPATGMTRDDRVIAWTGQALAVYTVGANQPLANFTEVDAQPLGAAWTGQQLVVWSDRTVWRLSPDDGKVLWQAPLGDLPALGAMPQDRRELDEMTIDEMEGMPQPRIIPGRRFGNLQAMQQAQLQQQQMPPADGPEQIIDLRPTDSRIVLLTSSGRLAGLDLTDGQLAWQVRLSDRGPQRMVATDEFTVARATDESSSTLLVVDTFSGEVLGRPRFSAATGAPLANFALSRQGVLVYTLADRLATKDLFETWEGNPPNERMAEGGPGNAVFSGAVAPDQLVVNDGLVAALSGGGIVRVYSLLTQREHLQQLATGGSEWEVSLRLVGTQLYTISPRTYRSFDLVNPAPPETQLPSLADMERSPTVRGAMFGSRHVVLLDTMGQTNVDAAVPSYRLWAFNRERVNGVENGIIDHLEVITDKAGITDWQAVDGGLYYRTGDAKLHFLRGARSE